MSAFDTRPFHFQQFSLYHHRSTMKVGTDAVLLGIWTDIDRVEEVLDIGTGSGIISLLLAARSSHLHVDAVELDRDSFEEATGNFRNSSFADRLHAFHGDITRFSLNAGKKYDLVISNPPFFIHDQLPKDKGRRLARHTDTLRYDQLVAAALRFMKPEGRFSLVLPYRESSVFLNIAENSGLYLHRKMLIFPKPCKNPNRINLLLGKSPANTSLEKFIIRNENNSFTSQYTGMVKNYYLSA